MAATDLTVRIAEGTLKKKMLCPIYTNENKKNCVVNKDDMQVREKKTIKIQL